MGMGKTRCICVFLALISLVFVFAIGCHRKSHKNIRQSTLKIIRPGPDFLGTTGKSQIFETLALGLNEPISWEMNGSAQGTGNQITLTLGEGDYWVSAKSSGLE